jgi:hypothetical protein
VIHSCQGQAAGRVCKEPVAATQMQGGFCNGLTVQAWCAGAYARGVDFATFGRPYVFMDTTSLCTSDSFSAGSQVRRDRKCVAPFGPTFQQAVGNSPTCSSRATTYLNENHIVAIALWLHAQAPHCPSQASIAPQGQSPRSAVPTSPITHRNHR